VIKIFGGFLKRKHKIGRYRFKGQSIVEFTILLPLLLMLLSGLIEFGFMLNEYLDLIDTTRETARYLSDQPPFKQDQGYKEVFYTDGIVEMAHTIRRAGWINLDSSRDDLVISVFSVTDWSGLSRYPTPFTEDSRTEPAELYSGECNGKAQGGEIGWRLYCNQDSHFTNAEVLDLINNTSSVPPNNGLVLIEIFYQYQMRLSLPWITAFVGDSIGLHAYSFAPNAYAEP